MTAIVIPFPAEPKKSRRHARVELMVGQTWICIGPEEQWIVEAIETVGFDEYTKRPRRRIRLRNRWRTKTKTLSERTLRGSHMEQNRYRRWSNELVLRWNRLLRLERLE
ncbi:MAG: hypothetical protein HYS43_00625 [Candidatus Liptonbacteria bacterium]|nr:hypothetical protein [Candidatus Liptonbacteria bacterium]